MVSLAFGIAVVSSFAGDLSLIIGATAPNCRCDRGSIPSSPTLLCELRTGLTSSVAGTILALLAPLLVWLAVFGDAPKWSRCTYVALSFVCMCAASHLALNS